MCAFPAPKLPAPPAPKEWLGASAARTLIGFDFDGTLVNLAPRPDLIHYDPKCLEWLKRVGDQPPSPSQVVLCSGRSVADLSRYAPPSMDLVGSHGLEWRVRGKTQAWVTPEWWGWRQLNEAKLTRAIHDHGGELEDKRVSFTLHFRSAPDYWGSKEAERWIHDLAGDHVRVMPGTMCWNLVGFGKTPGHRKALPMTKGESLIQFALAHQFEQIIYFGDEPTDETVFERTELPVHGVQVTTEEGHVHYAAKTAAKYQLRGIPEVHRWLEQLAEASRP